MWRTKKILSIVLCVALIVVAIPVVFKDAVPSAMAASATAYGGSGGWGWIENDYFMLQCALGTASGRGLVYVEYKSMNYAAGISDPALQASGSRYRVCTFDWRCRITNGSSNWQFKSSTCTGASGVYWGSTTAINSGSTGKLSKMYQAYGNGIKQQIVSNVGYNQYMSLYIYAFDNCRYFFLEEDWQDWNNQYTVYEFEPLHAEGTLNIAGQQYTV